MSTYCHTEVGRTSRTKMKKPWTSFIQLAGIFTNPKEHVQLPCDNMWTCSFGCVLCLHSEYRGGKPSTQRTLNSRILNLEVGRYSWHRCFCAVVGTTADLLLLACWRAHGALGEDWRCRTDLLKLSSRCCAPCFSCWRRGGRFRGTAAVQRVRETN